MHKRKQKIIGIHIPEGEQGPETAIKEVKIENPHSLSPIKLTVERLSYLIKQGKIFYYVGKDSNEVQVVLSPKEDSTRPSIRTHTREDFTNSLLHVQKY